MRLQKLLLKKNLQTSKNILLGKHFKPSKALLLIRLKRGAANSIQFQLVVNGPNKKTSKRFLLLKDFNRASTSSRPSFAWKKQKWDFGSRLAGLARFAGNESSWYEMVKKKIRESVERRTHPGTRNLAGMSSNLSTLLLSFYKLKFGIIEGRLHSTEAAFLLLTQQPPGSIHVVPKNFLRHCWDLSMALARGSGQRLETHLVLASGKLVHKRLGSPPMIR